MTAARTVDAPARPMAARFSVWPLIVGLATAGVVLAVWVWPLRPVSTTANVPPYALAVLFFLAEVCVLHVHVRRQAHTFSPSAIPIVVGLVFVAPAGLIVARLVGSAAALIFVRRQPPKKVLFNLSYFAVDCSVAVLVYRAVIGHHQPLEVTGWLAAGASTVTSLVVGSLAISVAIAAAEGVRVRLPFHSLRGIGIATEFVSTDLGLIAVATLSVAPSASWLLMVAGGMFFAAYRAHANLRQTNQGLAQLYSSSRTISSSLPTGKVNDGILVQATELLHAEIAELILGGDNASPAQRVVLRGGAVYVDDSETAVAALRDRTGLLDHGRARIERDGRRLGLLPGTQEWNSALIITLDLGDDRQGVLAVANPLSDVDQFNDADLRLLETFANHASIAIRNQTLVHDLQREATERHYQALHDALTGLPNRTLMHLRLCSALDNLEAGEGLTVMLIDLDGFKAVNDTLGHHYGDQLLQEVATRILDVSGSQAFVARLGGDEFAVLLHGCDPAEITGTANRVETRLLQPFEIADLTFEVGASIGIATAPEHGSDAPTLLQRADVAMYAAKRSGRRLEFYTAEADNYTPQRLALAAELRRTIERGELLVEYQPIVALTTDEVVGVEALARWHHPELGFVPPDTFIAVAEGAGLIRALAEHVLGVSLRQLAEWRTMGFDLSVAVNLSARNLLDDSLPSVIAAALAATAVPPSALTIEITESTLIVDPGRTVGTLNKLSGMGMSIAIDDFGTGYSSLSYLQRLPVDELKIDKSFVGTMLSDASDLVIVRSTIELAHNLGLHVTAEGVEDGPTLQLLAAAGCDQAQGYHLRRPGSAAQITRWLRERKICQRSLQQLLDTPTHAPIATMSPP